MLFEFLVKYWQCLKCETQWWGSEEACWCCGGEAVPGKAVAWGSPAHYSVERAEEESDEPVVPRGSLFDLMSPPSVP